ncbi:MAG TPA: hypothetical protein VJN88_03760 [Ktedonobacterales bacterium]|nr:hypothetical protein [Ktedonobacterales bacterium]
MGSWVVRAGEAQAQFLVDGYVEHRRMPGVYGFSVQYNAGSSVDDLALAGRFRNTRISFQDEDALQAVVAPLGYRLEFIPSPGGGFHHTCTLIEVATGAPLHALPANAASALSNAFQRMRNPHQIR